MFLVVIHFLTFSGSSIVHLRVRISVLAVCGMLSVIGTCPRGFAQFPTTNMEFLSHVPLSAMGGGGGSDIWGWTDPLTSREYALMGRTNGTAFVDVTDPRNPAYLGNLPSHTGNSLWRDIKVYQNYAYVVSDGNGPHGIQIFDLTTLRGVTTPQTFAPTAHWDGIRDAHNIAINEDSGFAYGVATNLGNIAIDLANPLEPVVAGTVAGGHDVQAVNYHGPDTDYAGREILFASPGNSRITIQDVTDKTSITTIANPLYPGGQYSHQGWLTDDHRYYYQNDELDTKWTHMWDVTDLDNPIYQGFVPALEDSIDHNLYVKGNYIYAANYTSGMQVFEITDPAAGELTRVASIDTFDGSGMFYDGAWSVYPFFDSGTLIISDMSNGLVVARLDLFDGDFNYDGDLNCADVNLLTAAVASGANDADYDITGDGLVNLADRDAWLVEAGSENLPSGNPFLPADADLNGTVDGQDFIAWNNHKFSTLAEFCSGDFNMDGVIDGLDFIAWNEFKFQTSDARGASGQSFAVPEPHSIAWWMLVVGMPLAARRRRV
jgi:choice-of-anchor B domain-containing protein